uniref:Uncharacterized protein n=1 Tax=Aplanochytrium stocchinoi TaxID=215587 RepID=A0A6S8EBA4_9STRA
MKSRTRKGKEKTMENFLGAFMDNYTSAEEKRCVISLDFGSTHCGVAYALTSGHEEGTRPVIKSKVYERKYPKEPTCCIFDSTTQQLTHFGFEARKEYLRRLENDEVLHTMYFEGRSIKMRLWDSSLRPDTSVQTVDGKGELPLIRVVAGILGYLKNEGLTLATKGTNLELEVSEVLWVITVPSIWQEADKQFMRKAAHKAKIIPRPESADLILALEPECAVIAAEESEKGFLTGDKVLTLDCGGGTVDICCVEVTATRFETKVENKDLPPGEQKRPTLRLRQLIEPTGGNWGSTYIDQNFLSFMSYLLEDPRLEKLRNKNPGAILELLNEFEQVKTSITEKDYVSMKGSKAINLAEILDTMSAGGTEVKLADLVETYNFKCEEKDNGMGGIGILGRKGHETNLVMPMALIKTFFKPVIDKILNEVESLLMKDELLDLTHLLLVGGFAESDVLQHELSDRLRDRVKLLLPRRPTRVVQKGAVEYGLDPAIISTRRARQTIGIKVTMHEEDIPDPDNPEHEKHKFFDKASKQYFVRDIFNAYVKKGQEIETTYIVSRKFEPQSKTNTKVKFDIYATDGETPLHVTEPGCVRLAKLVIDINPDDNPRLECRMRFASTEISAEIKNLKTGEVKELLLQYNNMGLSQAAGTLSTFVRVPVREIMPWGEMEFDSMEMSEML